MKLKAYDKYQKRWIYIEPTNDELCGDMQYYNNTGVYEKVSLHFSAVEGDKDSSELKRWSDLEQIEVVED